MREILFRGKAKHHDSVVNNRVVNAGEWLYGDLATHEDKGVVWVDSWHVVPETVGQYTGLKDKNGKRIFEGDIVEYKTMRLLVSFATEYGCFTVDGKFWMRGHKEFEVIGNIHDSPELLKEGGAE